MVNENNHVSNALLQSLELKYKSEIQAARATMMVYLSNPVGIGEHPQHLEEMDKLMGSLENSSGKLEKLYHYFGLDDKQENKLANLGIGLKNNTHSSHHYTSK
jgi:hypothetical protein